MSTVIDKLENLIDQIKQQTNDVEQKLESFPNPMNGTETTDTDKFSFLSFKVPVQQQDKFIVKVAQILGQTEDDEFEIVNQDENSVTIALQYNDAEVIKNELGAQFSFDIPDADEYTKTFTNSLATFDIAGYVDCVDESIDESDLSETLTKKKVVRGGKKLIKWVTNKEGFKVTMIDGKPKEVKMSPQEKKARAKGSKKAQKKKTGASNAKAQRSREKSMKKKGDTE